MSGGDAWGSYQKIRPSGGSIAGGFSHHGPMNAGFFEEVCNCSRDEYIRKHIDFPHQETVRRMIMSDQVLYRLGKAHFHDQTEQIRRLQAGEDAMQNFLAER